VPSANKTKKKKKTPKLNGRGRMLVTVWVTPELFNAWRVAARLDKCSRSDLLALALGKMPMVKAWMIKGRVR